jgi:hypothetical protein
MKNTFFLFIHVWSTAIASCKKDDSAFSADNLVGTIWKSDDNFGCIEFTSKTQKKFILPSEQPSLQ